MVLARRPQHDVRISGFELLPSWLESLCVRDSGRQGHLVASFELFLKKIWQIGFCVSQYFDYSESVCT